MKKLLVIVLGLAIAGCAWFSKNGPTVTTDSAKLLVCIETQAISGGSIASIALACGTDVAVVIEDVIHSLDARVAASPAAREAFAARAAMGLDGGR
jgi:hypothetical protein